MSESTARWLFERDPHTGKAVGLALLMVKDVAVAHGGSIDVQSSLGLGAKFRMRIPRGAIEIEGKRSAVRTFLSLFRLPPKAVPT